MATDLIKIEQPTVIAAFSANDGLDPFVQQARDLVSSFEHDLSTAKGRKATATLASNVSKLKVRLDDMGKELVSDWKTKAKAVDKSRKSMRDQLDEIRDDARKPLTDYEAEQERLAKEEAARLKAKQEAVQRESDHELALLMNDKFDTEKNQAKLDAERDRLEREQEIARKARRDAEARAEEAIRDKIAAEAREKLRSEQAEAARVAAEEKARIDAEAAVVAEQERQEAARQAEMEAQRKREANRHHVGAIRKAAKEALMNFVDEATAKKIVLAIKNGKIPNVAINY